MAAAVIPLITALVPAIPDIIKGVEKLFGAGKGTDKIKTATNLAQTIVNDLVNSGVLPKTVTADTNTLNLIVQTIVSEMIANGQLPSSATAPPASPPVPLTSGTKISVTGLLQLE